MHRLLICALAIVAGCYRPRIEGTCEVQCTAAAPACPAGLSCGTDGLCYDDVECSAIDASVDDGLPPDEAIITQDCVQTLLLGNVCPTTFLPGLTAPPTLLIDTSSSVCTDVLMSPGGEVCLIAAETIIVNTATVRVTGSRPLALFGRSSIVINTQGNVDLQIGGAGMRIDCNTPAGRTQGLNEAAGGGAGGTMVQRGGNGGIPTGYPAALAPVPMPITTLRGGCPGGAGGNTSSNSGGGAAGLGGGALQLISPGSVVVSGTINAYGGGGSGGTASGQAAGGGGGGSGGLIAIDANKIIINASAVLRAHGGAGGGGAAGTGTGGRGGDGVATDGTGAIGGAGMGGGNNGSGGTGSSDSSLSGGNGGATVNTGAGAGGGGGAAGAIVLRSAQPLEITVPAKIHPIFTTTP